MIPADASSRLTAQLRAASSAQDEASFVEAFGDDRRARSFARTAWSSLSALDASDVELRYISGGDVADRDDGSAQAVAEVSWRPGAASGLYPGTLHRASVAFRVVPHRDGTFAIVDAAPRTGLLPIWLIGDVTVEQVDSAVVISIDGGRADHPVGELAARAHKTVARVLPKSARTDVVVVAARTSQQMAWAIGQPVDAVQQIAAVTTRLDVADAAAQDAVIVLNPEVFATMDERAAQVVLSHEAVHQLTAAVGTSSETWVVEGFADYVALRDDTAPLSVSAGQILAEVTAGQVPIRLPRPSDFDAAGRGLGAVYESTWLIFRMLAEQHPESDLVTFYESVLSGTDIRTALRETFDLTEQQATAQWRDYLTKSASTVS
ncbi:hypothetical protein [Aeromicrobium sp. UC242_57]|uniref:hypothetical protein n=1 Tax=Aeromicrobium sp. UC242_57 TaxID=3374624 RepID=UPI003795CC0B